MTRPADWHPLTEDGRDPIPGDWELVQEAAARYRRTADAIQRAKELLGDVTDSEDGWRSEAGTAFRERATELSDDIWKAWGRYDATANALAGYWPELEDAQTESLSLRTEAIEVQAEIDSLNGRVEGAERDAETAADSDADDAEDRAAEATRQVENLQGQLDYQQGELTRLRNRLAEIVEAKDQAAQRAADAIGDFIGGDGLTDGFWDRVGEVIDAIKDVLILIGEWAGRIAAICGVLALLVGWIPVIGQALAAVLGTIALVASVFSMVGNALQGKWLNFALDVVGILTFGLGRAVAPMLANAGGVARFQAFRNTMAAFRGTGNRAARNAMAAGVVGDGATLAARAGTTFTRPAGLLGWGRAGFGGLGTEMAQSLRVLRSGSNWGDGLSQGAAGLRGIGGAVQASTFPRSLQAGLFQTFGMGEAASDALALGRASAAEAASSGGLGAAGLAAGGSAAGGAAAGLFGLIVVEGVGSLWNWPGLSEGDHPLVGEVTAPGDLSYDESEAMVR
ncbi:hypothetical protein RM844_24950 [Streptomyces sp. DSM 44915]|uniref:WXG100 family type VII secretion target n=1 Tax=Streptomyces chisholmiae TaxID=3075540 RepID=A0ABU2JX12_9ACTN|nr:hypothetical protein [Streptomyces sp. DSM 44915]MDT0269535.1 hypothetical protein [Streptomyces sp. DSM 44915]